MDLRETPAQRAFREEVRAWLQENLPDGWGTAAHRGPKTAAESLAFSKRWQRRLYEGGWAGLAWPQEYGGRGASILE